MSDGVFKDYLVTLSSAKPDWLTSKWWVHAESKSKALHFSMLLHDTTHKWPVVMVTISNKGANPDANLEEFTVGDPEEIDGLQRIYLNYRNKLRDC